MAKQRQQYLRTPFNGWPRMTAHLQRLGCAVNHKRVRRLLRLMGLEAIYPKPHTTVVETGNRVYPYLLRDLALVRPNQVWSADITYVPMAQGFMYLVAIIDWFNRYMLAWQLSNNAGWAFLCGDAGSGAADGATGHLQPFIPPRHKRFDKSCKTRHYRADN